VFAESGRMRGAAAGAGHNDLWRCAQTARDQIRNQRRGILLPAHGVRGLVQLSRHSDFDIQHLRQYP
jgi:hypothetical protein